MARKKILAVGPHPDDIEFTIGGILIKEIKKGNSVDIVVMTRGEASTNGTPQERQAEAQAAAKSIGAKLQFGNFGGDCHVIYSVENVIAMARIIRQLRPDIVMVNTDDVNQHPDHVQVSLIVRAAARLARYGGVEELKSLKPHAIGALYLYPATLNTSKQPDIIIDITQQVSQWQKAMAAHKTQLKTRKYIDLVMARAKLLGMSINADYAQGLYTNDPLVLDIPSDISGSARTF